MSKNGHKVRVGKLSEFRPQSANANRHTERGLRMLDDAMSEDGYVAPMTAAADREVIDGSARLERAYDKFNDEAIILEHDGTRPIVTVRTDIANAQTKQAKRISVAANRIAEVDLEWNPDILQTLEPAELAGMFSDKELAEILSQTGVEPKDAEPQIDKAEELQQKWQVATGEIIEIGSHLLICGDCLEPQTVEHGQGAAMIYADPPYGIDLDTDFSGEKSSLQMLRDKKLKGGRRYARVVNDDKDYDPSPLLSAYRIKEVFLWGADYYAERIPSKNEGSWFVWDKRLDESADKMYGSGFELCWSKRAHKRDVVRVKWAGVFGVEKEPERQRFHPNQKPVELSRWFIDRFSKTGDLIVDPYTGAGGTMVACENAGRKCVAVEITQEFCAVTLERMSTAFPHLKIHRVKQARAAA